MAWIDCDHVDPDGYRCENSTLSDLYIPDVTPTPITRARTEATTRFRWVHRGGRDYCPDHTPTGVAR